MKNNMLLVLLYVAACQQNSPLTNPEKNTPPTSATLCYTLKLGNDLTVVQLTFEGEKISDFYAWEPHEKDAGRGKVSAAWAGDEISGEITYMIEGNIPTEEVRFKKTEGKLLLGHGELDDNSGKPIFKKPTGLTYPEVLSQTDCTSILAYIQRARKITNS